MATKFQEHCPDIERQETDVQKLNKRVNNVQKQIDSRWEIETWLVKVPKIFVSVILEKNTEQHTTKESADPLKMLHLFWFVWGFFCLILQVSELTKS